MQLQEIGGKDYNNYFNSYLTGGGELGELIGNYDWSATPIGTPNHWPISSLNTLSTLPHSKFPMFLFWGADNICFYNDAFRPSLGDDGKHPCAVGKKAIDVWGEIWEDIKPMIESVLLKNEPIWNEDQLLPIYRNGRIENVYWTYSYSAVIGDKANLKGYL